MTNIIGLMLTIFMTTLTSVNLGEFLVISHRGLPSEAPAHTFEGYDLAIAQGSLYIEQDVVLSKDGYLIVSHNDRIAKGKKITCMTLEEIKEIKNDNDEPYYTLEEVFERYGSTINYVIENKVTDDEFTSEKAILRAVKRYRLENNVMFQSFFPKSLSFFQDASPSIPRMILVEKHRNVDILKNSEKYDYVDIVAMESKMLDGEKADYLREAGFKVFAYFSSEPKKEAKRVIELGLDGVFTDYTGRTFEMLEEVG